jgi:hypothetical protein
MAHHNNTPRSILDAPTLAPRWVVRHTGPNRRDRRKLALPKTGRVITLPKPLRAPATNSPLVRKAA